MKHLIHSLFALVLLGGVLLLSGCSLGRNNLVFVTKTSYGLDVDRTPPTFHVAYGRKEGMLGPVYANGADLPVLASFHSEDGAVRTSIGQSFATGKAAELLAQYLGTSASLTPASAIAATEITGKATVDVGTGEAKAHFFGTETTFGVTVLFAPEANMLPESLAVGYKRKEAALVPIRINTVGTNNSASVPSLVATIGVGVQADNFAGSKSSRNQFFASGKAADYLMARREIRDTIGFRVLNDQEAVNELRLRTYSQSTTSDRLRRWLEAAPTPEVRDQRQAAIRTWIPAGAPYRSFDLINRADLENERQNFLRDKAATLQIP